MSNQEGVFSVMGNTFSLWASFRQSRNEPVLGLFYRYISDRGFVVVAVSVEAPVIYEFKKFVEQHSQLAIALIDGNPTPNALWIGHWTHFTIKGKAVQAPLLVPQALSQSEKFLRKLLNGEMPLERKPRRQVRKSWLGNYTSLWRRVIPLTRRAK
jgi:hypothetical protein